MTQEIKDKLEQAHEFHAKEGTIIRERDSLNTFTLGAQTILDNPGEFGLVDAIKAQHSVCDVLSKNEKLATEVTHMHYQLKKYREALERLLEENMCSHAGDELIEETLKHESKD